jgi:hypothetical protein
MIFSFKINNPKISLAIFCIIITFFSCNQKTNQIQDNVEHFEITEDKTMAKSWDEIFTNHQILEFSFSNPSMEIYRIGDFFINSRGEYFIQDPKARRIRHFSAQRKFIRNIGSTGEGPGQYLMGALAALDNQDNLIVFDIMKSTLIRYLYPEYSHDKEFSIKTNFNGYINVGPEDRLIAYSRKHPIESLIIQFNNKGKIIKQVFEPQDKNYIHFITRFGMGRVNDFLKQGIVFMNPQKYEIYIYDYDLNIKRILKPQNPSKFFPFRENFPKSLPFYDFTRKHAKWWQKSLVPLEAKTIGEKFIIGMVAQFTKYIPKIYINIHDTNGKTYAKGIEIPFDGMIMFIKGKHIYVREDDSLNEKGEIAPPRIHRYTINL